MSTPGPHAHTPSRKATRKEITIRLPNPPVRLLAASLWLLGPPALASDGIVEINRTCAVQTGCFPGDTAGYPVTITGTAGRSYQLTGDLFISGQNTTAIEISANEITIDLAGFRIHCSNFSPPSTIQPCSATGPGSGSGITVDDEFARSGVEVHNGSVLGMPQHGLNLGKQCVVRGLRVSESGVVGIRGSNGCTIERNNVYKNNPSGTAIGVLVGSESTVSGNTVIENGGPGITAGSGSTVSGNTASKNGSIGINAGSGSTVSGNTASANGLAGISTGSACNVAGNTARSNSGFGMSLGFSDTGYRENVITSNDGGTVNGGVDLGGNLCDGSTTCP